MALLSNRVRRSPVGLSALAAVLVTVVLSLVLSGLAVGQAQPARAVDPISAPTANCGSAAHPFMGWSSWSEEGVQHRAGYGGQFLDQQNVHRMSDAMRAKLGAFGYRYVDLDAGWSNAYDRYGRPLPNAQRFPQGMAALGRVIHGNGQCLGVYLTAGLPNAVRVANSPILGTRCHARDILLQPEHRTNGWNRSWAINWSNPCSQAYIDSIVAEFAGWGVNLIKLDGVTPGSTNLKVAHPVVPGTKYDNRGDVAAWAKAIRSSHHPMWLQLSWWLDQSYAGYFARYANSVRISGDIDCYCHTLTKWANVLQRIILGTAWTTDASQPMLRHDFDALDVGVGSMDGLTRNQRRFAATLWAAGGSPLYSGDDLTRLDAFGLSLLTNRAVIAVDQSGHPLSPRPDLPGTSLLQQVWAVTLPNHSVTLALFNLGSTPAAFSVPLAALGLAGTASQRDLWTGGVVPGVSTVAMTLPGDSAQLLTLTPAG